VSRAGKMTLSEYEKFLDTKRIVSLPTGIADPPPIHPAMFAHQQAVTRWALRRGKACNWMQTGLGKSLCEIEFSRVVHQHTGGNALIVTPLAVARQFVDEGKRIGVDVNLCREPSDVKDGVNVLNFDRVERFMHLQWASVTIDESSCLKDYTSARRNLFIDGFQHVPFRLACSATPAPNDHTEIGNHAEFLGVMKRTEMLAQFFVHDGETTQEWRLKGHAKGEFWRWVAGWAIAINSPADIGFDDSGYILPPLTIKEHVLDSRDAELARANGQLFAYQANTLSELRSARRVSMSDRVAAIAEMVNVTDEPWICWADLNDESKALAAAIPDAIEVTGSDDPDVKEDRIIAFAEGRTRVIVSKPAIMGAGLNLQRCANQAFASLSFSWERFYQAVRRSYRFGQMRPVNVHIFISSAELAVLESIKRKQADADAMAAGMVEHMKETMVSALGVAPKKPVHVNGKKKMVLPPWL
jgi:hypothetical protein